MRFLIEVERSGGGWDVTVTGPDLDRRGRMEAVDDGAGGRFPAPAAGACPDAAPEHAGCLRGGAAVRDAYEEVAIRREPSDPKTIARLGRYLFDALIGQDTWEAVAAAATGRGARVVELALSWPADDHDLHRLNWELLHDGTRFLAEGSGQTDVTITRVVSGGAATGRTNPAGPSPDRAADLMANPAAGGQPDVRALDGPPRLLFVIGSGANDPAIRPGAEAIGLLRHVERDGSTIHHHILESATPERLTRAMREFRPHAVHFICHGEVRGGESVLLLRPDETDRHEPEPRDATQLLQLLRADGTLPRLVVLSACESGPAPRLLGGHQTAPLAARLVQGGVPVVVGMAGAVSDLACRLFTRAFGKALVGGRSLVEASAEARRAGLSGGALTGRSVDWALPAVFMDVDVDPARPLLPAGGEETTQLVNGWISSYRLNESPVFCGRSEFLDAYWRMLHGDRAKVLAAFVRGESVHLGRTRLLRELAKQALRDGNVPLLLGTDRTDDPPRTLPVFCKSVERAMTQVRRWLDLPLHATGQLGLVRAYDPAHPADPRLDPYIGLLLSIDEEATPEVVKLALQMDLGRLAADARSRHAHVAAGSGRVILLLDGIDDGAVNLVETLHDRLLDDHGLGTAEEPVPVVLAFAYSGRDNLLRQIAEGQSGKPWLEVRELRPFQPDGEDLLAYEQVMLHPFNPAAMAGVSDLPWVFNRELEPQSWEERVATTRQVLKGHPGVFREPIFYTFLAMAKHAAFVKEADDEHLLATFREAGPPP